MIGDQLLILGVDVGSVRRKGGFSWSSADASLRGEDDLGALGDVVVTALDSGHRVALAFECPLSVPVPDPSGDGWKDLGRARAGEGNRSWSAGAGTGALATGLVQLTWVLGYFREHARVAPSVTTQVGTFAAARADLLIAEAMVTGDGKPEAVDGFQDHADAVAAAKRFEEILASGSFEPDVTCAPHRAFNLAAGAAMQAGLAIDQAELRLDVLVAKGGLDFGCAALSCLGSRSDSQATPATR